MANWRQVAGGPRRLWWSSLPLRVVSTTFLSALLVLVLGGMLLMQQATHGVLDSKRRTAVAEAQTALDYAQVALRDSSLNRDSVDQRLIQVAADATNRGAISGQYEVIVEGRSAWIQVSGVLRGDPVPSQLRQQMRTQAVPMDKLFVTPTTVRYSDGRQDAPGLVVGAFLEAQPTGERFPIYFVFPLANEVHTIDVLQQATLTVGALLLLALSVISFLIGRQVVSPVRRAARTAGRIASGELGERLPVKGTDELAMLGSSMNNMASELQDKIEQYEALSRVQQRFVSDVSHELRTPLTTVRMAADLLYDDREDMASIDKRSAEILHDELDRFESMLADLLEISRFDAGSAVLSPELVDVAELVSAEVEANRMLAEHAGSRITIQSEGPTAAAVDARRVRRIIRNLLTNAIEHGEGRAIDVRVCGDTDAVAVVVRDHGVGFEREVARRVFDRFWRADPARTRTVGGTGLGLAISMEDAQLHGGWLHAWGRPGRGAQFRLTLPCRTGEPLRSSPLPIAPEDAR